MDQESAHTKGEGVFNDCSTKWHSFHSYSDLQGKIKLRHASILGTCSQMLSTQDGHRGIILLSIQVMNPL